MAVNKNFVVKNLEVNTNLIVADTDAQKVGIGTTISRYLLHVNGGTGIGASSVYVTGISTVAQEFNVGLSGSIFTVLGNAEGTAGMDSQSVLVLENPLICLMFEHQSALVKLHYMLK